MPNSYNGWPVQMRPPLDNSVIPGTDGVRFAPGVLAGDVATVLFFVGFWLHRNIEPAGPGCWGHAYRQNRNAANWSCHASATAADWRAPLHPNGKRGTWGPAHAARIRSELLAYLEGVVRWGEDFTGVPDGMHFEIAKGRADVARVAAKILRDHGPREQWGRAAAPGAAAGADIDQVKRDQADLTDTGFPVGPIDGDWGPASIGACQRFQQAARLEPDGICGPATRAALRKVPSWKGDPVGDGGQPASRWQQELRDHGWRIQVDNDWGPHSTSILAQFQAERQLIRRDGVRDSQAWAALHCVPN